MKNTKQTAKLFLIPTLIIFLLAVISASSVTTSLFYDTTIGNTLTINDGNSTGISVSADSLFENSMTINVDLLNSNGNVIANLLNTYTTSDSYFNHFFVGKSFYSNPGNYTIKSTVTAESGQTDTDTLSLIVVAVNPGNSVPVITSTPVGQVNETQNYLYQVVATDADNDSLTYSLTQNPAWISISATGAITGTAPNVVSDYSYAVTARVSDGKDSAIQTFSVIVKDTNQGGDTTAPFLTLVSPVNGQTYTSSNVLFRITTNEAVSTATYRLDGGASVSMDMTISTDFTKAVTLTNGSHSVVFTATDLAGNVGTSSTVNFVVNTSAPDTTAPIITFVSPIAGQIYTSSSALFEITTNEAVSTATYSLDGGSSVAMDALASTDFASAVTLTNGNHNVVFTATDLAGNVGTSSTVNFVVNIGVVLPDTTPPIITVTSISNNQIFTSPNVNFDMASNEPVSEAWIKVDGGNNISLSRTSPFNFRITLSLADGNHSVVFYAKDSAGNVGVSNTINFSIDTTIPDTTAPVVAINNPVNGIIYTSHVKSINYSVTDANLDRCWYSLNGGINITVSCNSPITGITSKEGTNTWTIYATDLAGNVGSQSVTFNVNIPNGKSSGDKGEKHLSDSDGTTQYLSQFGVSTANEDDGVLTINSQQTSAVGSTLIWLVAGIFFLIIALGILWIRR